MSGIKRGPTFMFFAANFTNAREQEDPRCYARLAEVTSFENLGGESSNTEDCLYCLMLVMATLPRNLLTMNAAWSILQGDVEKSAEKD